MKTKLALILLTFFALNTVLAQTNLNSYKYVIVPNKYDFLKEQDQYQLNALTKFLFNKYGFEAVLEGENYPEDLALNRCLGLQSDVLKDSGLFKTKLTVQLKDCNGKTVYTSDLGESREKEFKTAYQAALRDAFTSIAALNHKFEPSEAVQATLTSQKETANTEIEKLKQEIATLKKEKQTDVAEVAEIKQTQTESAVQEKRQAVKEKVEEKLPSTTVVTEIPLSPVLYAQEIPNGYQLVDSTPKVVYKIKKTGRENVFFVEGENAIIYKQGETWIYEYNTDAGMKQKELNIKF